jgi:hypothetical protein
MLVDQRSVVYDWPFMQLSRRTAIVLAVNIVSPVR